MESDLAQGLFFVKVADGGRLSAETVLRIVTDAGFTLRSFDEVDETTGEE